MGWTTDLLYGVAEHLAATGAGTWQPTGTYLTGTARPIVLSSVPGSPDEVIVLSAYGGRGDPGMTDVVQGVQARTRGVAGSVASVLELDDLVRDALDGLRDVVLHGIPIVLVTWDSGAPLGTDGNRRHERSANYYINAIRTSPYRYD